LFDPSRVALVLALDQESRQQGVATGYFISSQLILTVRHVGDPGASAYRVRADLGHVDEQDRWSDAIPTWVGSGALDAMVLRTERPMAAWPVEVFAPGPAEAAWHSSGFARLAHDETKKDRKTLPINGRFARTGGQGEPQLALSTEQHISANWDEYWKGVSGAPVALEDDGAIVGIVTDATRASPNTLTGLPIEALLADPGFLSLVTPTFLGELPTVPWCLVITAEGQGDYLVGEVEGVLDGYRDSELAFDGMFPRPVRLDVNDALSSPAAWLESVAALAKADYVVADVTGYQPGVMLLLGARSVLRRGVTISVRAGESLVDHGELPFNVRETRVLSYAKSSFFDDLHNALAGGITSVRQDPNYLDLPAYHAVRTPRSELTTENHQTSLLFLCPFAADYSDFFRRLQAVVRGHTGNLTPTRMLDLRSPRLVGQALYEQIRWSRRCIVDLSRWRANVFFELGVRLACSEYDPLCLLDGADVPVATTPYQQQKEQLQALLGPVGYEKVDPRPGLKDALSAWRASTGADWPGRTGTLGPGMTYATAQTNYRWESDPVLRLPHVELRESIEQAMGREPERQPERMVLFSDGASFGRRLDASVLERWIAAWTYLRHLDAYADTDVVSAADVRLIATLASQALRPSDDPRHLRVRQEIRDYLRQRRTRADESRATVVDRDLVFALKASAREARSEEDWEFAVADLEEALAILQRALGDDPPAASGPTAPAEMADIYGTLGGIHRRWGLQLSGPERDEHLAESVAAYDRGHELEVRSGTRPGSTYNRINRLVARVLLNPSLLTAVSDPGHRLSEELRTAEELVRYQLDSSRVKDPWAYCDLLTLELLLERPSAGETVAALAQARPPRFVFESALSTLEPLARAVRPYRPAFDQSVDQLRRLLG
jgi:hypothetical protein